MIEEVCDAHVIGADPFHIERLWRDVYGRGYSGRPDISLLGVLSGIEMACWDIVGKAVGKPVYELLGGRVHERLRGYTYLYREPDDATDVYLDPELAGERAAEYVGTGFTALKFDPAGHYTTFDPRQPGLEELDRCERVHARRCGRRSAAAATSCSERTASSRRPARSGSRGASRRTTRSGSRSRRRPSCPRRWRAWRARPRSRSRPASG